MNKKLDLSRLTDDEAKHVWEVIQRDFNLRKKEEERLGQLKTIIEKEGSKRQLIAAQTNLAESHCIHCLHPFRFLVNSKRQCLDCQLFTCKSCSRYSKKDRGWVCDPCRMGRLLKIGTLGWYHDNIRTRFKRFGSAKVMRSLYKRLNGERTRDDDTVSMPDVSRSAYNGHDDDYMDAAEAQRYKAMRKTKRLLSVHPLDFDVDEYMAHSRRQSVQHVQDDRGARNDADYTAELYHQHRMNRRKSLDRYTRPDEASSFSEHRMVRARSLSKINASLPQRSAYLDTSEEEDGFRYPVYQLPPRRRSRASSQENVSQAPPINELNKRMSAIESLLNRLEEKISSPPELVPASTMQQQVEADKLRRKLDELMSDRALSSSDDDDEGSPKKSTQLRSPGPKRGPLAVPSAAEAASSSSSDEVPTEAQKVYITAGSAFEMQKKLQMLEQNTRNQYGCMTDSELSELEDQVARAAAKVQSTESEVRGPRPV
ncbi:hypothetical protein ACEWY4_016290 [Coilia grayii]|uniref:RabBD domain-containing protein n=1 Tax=Coilia grayii TaxID=363190 RepID=A0ABD1JK48_9TELE